MTYVYRLAGENLELAMAEIEGFLESQGINEDPSRTGRIAKTESHPSQLRRLALVHEVIETKDPTKYTPEGRYKVRAKNLSSKELDVKNLEEKIGEQLESSQNTVDLENPEETVRVYTTDDEEIIGREVENIPRGKFNQRSAEKRPFSEPISLDPELARVLVNLSKVSAGSYVLDPFCGTGGILIEAGLCGIGVRGIDNQEKMVDGTQRNLEEYGIIRHKIKNNDFKEALEVFEKDQIDAIVTDLPYGKSTKSNEKLAENFVDWIREENMMAVFMYNQPDLEGLDPSYSVRIHKNLTRYVYIHDSD